MPDSHQEAPAPPSTSPIARQTERPDQSGPGANLARFRWLLRFVGGVAVAIAAAVVIAARAISQRGDEMTFYLVTALVFLCIYLIGFALAAHSSKVHVELERRYRARLFIRNLELQDMAMRDDLTQLFNRRYFFERLRRELERARALQSPLAILVADVDHLKDVNDSYGHQAGDVVLANLAKMLVKCTRVSDIPARLGGDEFGVIMPETDKDGAFAMATRLQRALEVTPVYEQDGASLKLNVSLGVSGFPWGGDSVDEVVQWADTHVYAAKTTRKKNGGPSSTSRSAGSRPKGG